jgi:photosystem II stability/assembly factor-like uncharacterized protein
MSESIGRGDGRPGGRRGVLATLAACALGAAATFAADGEPADPVLDQAAEPARLAASSLLLDVVALPGNRLVAVGERGHALVSVDGGGTWKQSAVPVRATLTATCFLDARTGIAVGHDDVILRTADAGATWQRVFADPSQQRPLLDAWCGAGGRVEAFGAFSARYSSADAGATWVATPFEPAPLPGAAAPGSEDEEGLSQPHLNAVTQLADGTLLLAGESGALFRSTDGGATWAALAGPYDGSWFALVPLDGARVLALGLRGHLFASADAGTSWTAVPSGTEAMLTAGTRLADGTVVLVGLAGTVLVSRDGGQAFGVHQEADRKGLAGVAPAGANGVVVVGEAGARRLDLGALKLAAPPPGAVNDGNRP